MNVKEEYKQTEVGVIPADWDLRSISSIAEIVGGGTPSTTVAEYWNGQIPWVNAGDVSNANGRYIQSTAYRISEIGLVSCPARIVPAGTTVIIARGATVGRMAQLKTEMTFNQTCYGLLPKTNLNSDYLYYSMLFSINSIKALTYGTIFGTITTNSFEEWKIPFPPLPEQQAIAAALSDMDALLAALDALIAKKRLVKQGAMQELLMGKKRLPGFSAKWEIKRLDEIGGIDTENLANQTSPDYQFKYISLEDVDTGVLKNYTELAFRNAPSRARRKIRKNDILIATVRPNLRSHLLIREDVFDMICSTGFSVLRCDPDKAIPAYALFHLFAYYVEQQIETLLSGSNYPAINHNDVCAIRIPLPPLREQTAIAEVLSDMDAEIAALEARREKTRLLKQGMMQELLTGRVRLV